MWTAQSEKILKQKNKKERVNFLISKEYRDRFKLLCNKNGLIMSVFIENAIRRFVDGRWIITPKLNNQLGGKVVTFYFFLGLIFFLSILLFSFFLYTF